MNVKLARDIFRAQLFDLLDDNEKKTHNNNDVTLGAASIRICRAPVINSSYSI
jgi:hypothetical protein